MIRLVWHTVRHGLRALLYGVVGGGVVIVIFAVHTLDSRPDLSVWHTVHLDEEFTKDSTVQTFAEYLSLEDRLFEELEREVYDQIASKDRLAIVRYNRGSLADPGRWPRNWNRTFELSRETPLFGVLLIHGMSDSPYSVRSLATRLHEEGAYAIGLRVPGHGTAPSGLVEVDWQDMAAAVRITMRHLREAVGDRPIMIVGYSNGGALAVHYALDALGDDRLPRPARLVLLSPEIGITKLAALAVWQERLGHVLGLEKLAWNSIQPEYDPFKYGSFALNAGKQAYLITQEIQSLITQADAEGLLARFPPTLAFQSVVDATVEAPVLVTGLFARLHRGGHELVLFDLNRFAAVEHVLKSDPARWLDAFLHEVSRTFTASLVTNENQDTRAVVVRRRRDGETDVAEEPLDLRWPDDVYSLAHISLPFPPDDPLYGGPDAAKSPGIALGNVALRGERGVLEIASADMLRLRWNPFHPYIAARVLGLVQELETAGR